MVGLALASAVDPGPLFFALLIVAAYLGLRMVMRGFLGRHDRPVWAALGVDSRYGRIDDTRLAEALGALAHPVLRSAVAVALAHLRVDRGDLDGARRCLGRMSPLCRSVLRRALDEAGDGPGLDVGTRLLVLRARWAPPTEVLGGLGGKAADLPVGSLFCTEAVVRGRGHYRRAFSIGEALWSARPHAVVAYNCACALARVDQPSAAMEWLGRALAGGYPADDLAADEDLASLRTLPAFAALAQGRPAPG